MTLKHPSTIPYNSVWNKLFACARRFPLLYSLLLIPIAILGFGYLLLFPIMFCIGTFKVIQLLVNTPVSLATSHIDMIAVWTGITIIAALTTRQLIKIQFTLPEGITINQPTAARLHTLLHQISREIPVPKIDSIIITEQLSMDIIKTPSYPLPLWSVNTLVVGLPLMQCLSPDYFRCAMVRKLIQHSKHNHIVPKWVAQCRSTWMQYLAATSPAKGKSNILLHVFFKFYSPVYRQISIPVANYVELAADLDTLSIVNDEDLLQTIEKVVVTKIYLEKQYWPKIRSMIHYNRYNLIEPYTKLEQVLKHGITPQLSKRWLDSVYQQHATAITPVPDLRSRMNNIGRSKIRLPEKTNETAAHYFLDKAYLDIISEANQLWLVRSNNLDADNNTPRKPFIPQPSGAGAASRMNTELFN